MQVVFKTSQDFTQAAFNRVAELVLNTVKRV